MLLLKNGKKNGHGHYPAQSQGLGAPGGEVADRSHPYPLNGEGRRNARNQIKPIGRESPVKRETGRKCGQKL